MQNFLLIFGAILLVGAGGRAVFQLLFLVLGAAGQAGTSISKNIRKDEASIQQAEENLARIKAFNQDRLHRIIVLAIVGAVGGLMIYASSFAGK